MDFGHRGLWSALLSILGVVLLYIAFTISKGTHLGEAIVVGSLCLSSISSLIAGLVFGIRGVLEREKGLLKYVGILIIIILIAFLALTPFVSTLFTDI